MKGHEMESLLNTDAVMNLTSWERFNNLDNAELNNIDHTVRYENGD